MLVHSLEVETSPDRVVVLGSRGFIGAALVAGLASDGVPSLALDRTRLDLLASNAASTLAGFILPTDCLVVISALTPDRGKDAATLMKNLSMGQAVADAIAAAPPAHVVYVSSDAVYRDDAALADERTPAAPASFHGQMHLVRETMLAAVFRGPLARLRPSLVYGRGDTHNGYGPNRFLREGQAGNPIKLFGQGEEMRDHISIDDVVELIRRTIRKRSSGVLNLVTGRSASFRDVAVAVGHALGRQVEIVGAPRGGPITHRHYDVAARIRAFPDFTPLDLQSGLARALG